MHRFMRAGACALGLALFASGAGAAVIYPGVNQPATATGVSSAVRKPARSIQTFIDSSFLGDITEPMKISALSFRPTANFSNFAPNYTWPTATLNFADYEITLAKGDAASTAANGFQSDTFAANMSNAVVVRSGALTIPQGSFTDTNNGPGPANSANFSFFIPFTTEYTINPGEDLVVFIRHNGYSQAAQATTWNFETFTYTNGERIAVDNFADTAHDQGASFRNEAMKFAFEVNPVPEPTSAVVLVAAGGLMALRRRRAM